MSQSIATSVATESFSFENFPVRAINRNGEIWFVAADVCAVLDIKNPSDAIKALDDDEYTSFNLGYSGIRGNPNVNIINESGLYALILRSRKPEAKRFRKWVTSEVLPAIRKTGSYSLTISKTQQGELATLIAERFPSGKDRPYAWSRFNNHFRLASYKDLPASRFEEACEYIKTMLGIARDAQDRGKEIMRNILSLKDESIKAIAYACIEVLFYRTKRERLREAEEDLLGYFKNKKY